MWDIGATYINFWSVLKRIDMCRLLCNSDSDSTFMVLNPHLLTDSKVHNARNQRL